LSTEIADKEDGDKKIEGKKKQHTRNRTDTTPFADRKKKFQQKSKFLAGKKTAPCGLATCPTQYNTSSSPISVVNPSQMP
jgi:hypothetical protein